MINNIRNMEDGLTLIEVMISLLIFSIVALMVFRFIDFGMTSFTYGVDQTEDQANLRLTAYKITDTVRNARQFNLVSSTGDLSLKESIVLTSDKLIHTNEVGDNIPLSQEMITSAMYTISEKNNRYLLTISIQGSDQTLVTDVLLNNIWTTDNVITTNTSGSIIDFDFDAP